MEDLTLIDWKSPIDGRLRPRMATPTFKFTGMDERNTPKTEQLRYKNRGDSLTNLMNQSDLPGLKLHYRGKVGDMYDLGEHLLLVATDRISGFDVVNAALIPQKGAIRTQLSRFWFERTEHIVPNHLVSTDLSDMSEAVRSHQDQLDRRAMLVRKAQRVDIECVVRGYLAGSGWKEYQNQGTVCEQKLPAGLRESDRLPEPIFTPATKADTGHDENISVERMADLVGSELTERLKNLVDPGLPVRRRPLRVAWNPPGRYQVRVRLHRWRAIAHRRSIDAGLVTLLAGRPVRAGTRAAELR